MNPRWAAGRAPHTSECEAIPANRNGNNCEICDPKIGNGPQARHFGISTAPDLVVHDSSAIVAVVVVGNHLLKRIPVAGQEMGPLTVICPRCGILQLRCRSTEFVEPCDCGVEILFVEDLASVE